MNELDDPVIAISTSSLLLPIDEQNTIDQHLSLVLPENEVNPSSNAANGKDNLSRPANDIVLESNPKRKRDSNLSSTAGGGAAGTVDLDIGANADVDANTGAEANTANTAGNSIAGTLGDMGPLILEIGDDDDNNAPRSRGKEDVFHQFKEIPLKTDCPARAYITELNIYATFRMDKERYKS